jgi:hypothetical protein
MANNESQTWELVEKEPVHSLTVTCGGSCAIDDIELCKPLDVPTMPAIGLLLTLMVLVAIVGWFHR